MIERRSVLAMGAAGLAALGVGWDVLGLRSTASAAPAGPFKVSYSDAEWRSKLSPAQFDILREQGTEPPFSSPLDAEHRKGVFACAACEQKLYNSDTKFDSGTGWPSFYQPISGAVGETVDRSLGMERTEVHCANCGGHLGHVFEDGPKPTGLRYCMNGLAMKFQAI
jgi:peptide-methionine (R)-S-oxide reductase